MLPETPSVCSVFQPRAKAGFSLLGMIVSRGRPKRAHESRPSASSVLRDFTGDIRKVSGSNAQEIKNPRMRGIWICLGHMETTPGIKSGEIWLGLEGFGGDCAKRSRKPGKLKWNWGCLGEEVLLNRKEQAGGWYRKSL